MLVLKATLVSDPNRQDPVITNDSMGGSQAVSYQSGASDPVESSLSQFFPPRDTTW